MNSSMESTQPATPAPRKKRFWSSLILFILSLAIIAGRFGNAATEGWPAFIKLYAPTSDQRIGADAESLLEDWCVIATIRRFLRGQI